MVSADNSPIFLQRRIETQPLVFREIRTEQARRTKFKPVLHLPTLTRRHRWTPERHQLLLHELKLAVAEAGDQPSLALKSVKIVFFGLDGKKFWF
jgi:hypothetical protein